MRMLTQPLTVALLCAILTVLMGLFAWLKGVKDTHDRELLRQRQVWDTAIHQELKALPDPFETPKWNDQKDKSISMVIDL